MEDVNASGVSSLSTSSDEQETSKKKMTIKSLKTWNERKKSLLTDLVEKRTFTLGYVSNSIFVKRNASKKQSMRIISLHRISIPFCVFQP